MGWTGRKCPACAGTGDEYEGLRPMSEAPKDRTPILALTRSDLQSVRGDLDRWSNKWVVVHHQGVACDGWDSGWNVNAPVGNGGLPDEWFVGWHSLPKLN